MSGLRPPVEDGAITGVPSTAPQGHQSPSAFTFDPRDADEWLRRALDALQEAFFVFDAIRDGSGAVVDLRYRYVNAAAERMYGQPASAVIGRGLCELFPSVVDLGIFDCYIEPFTTGRSSAMRVPSFDDNGVAGAFDVSASPFGDGVVVVAHDVTAEVRAQALAALASARYQLLAEHASDVVATGRADGTITWVSPAVTQALGWQVEEFVGRNLDDLVHPDDQVRIDAMNRDLEQGSPGSFEARILRADGHFTWIAATVHPIEGPDPDSARVAGWRDIDDVVAARHELEQRASHDDLTGLLNRAEAILRLAAILDHPPRIGGGTAVAFCDIDDFKGVNDHFGHGAGDEALRTLARRIQTMVRRGDLVARFGGDEILVVLEGVDTLDDAIALSEKLRRAALIPIPVLGGSFSVTLSVGVTLAVAGEDLDTLIERADNAMYEAKRGGKDRVHALPAPQPDD